MLAMQIHELTADFSQNCGSHRCSIYPGAPTAVRGNFPLEHQRVILDIDPTFVGHRRNSLHAGDVEDAFHCRFLSPRSNEIGARPFSQQQAQSTDDDRLSGTRFARENVESLGKRKRHLLDDRKVPDSQLCQHQYGWSRSGSPPQPSLTLIRSKNVAPGNRTIRTGLSAFLTFSFSPLTKLVPT